MLLLLTLIATTVNITIVNAQSNPNIYVDPFEYTATKLNEVFDISINIEGIEEGMELVGVEFKLGFDATLLEVVNVTEGSFMATFAGTPNQGTYFLPVKAENYVLIGVVILPDGNGTYHAPFASGNGTIATITFKTIYRPSWSAPLASCDLVLYDTKLADTTGVPPGIPHTILNGNYIASIQLSTLEVSPETVLATHRGEEINISIDIKNLDRDWKVVGFEFKLGFDGAFEVINVTEGQFLKAFGETHMISVTKHDSVLIGIILLPHENGNWTAFPEGSGTLATICFNVTHGPVISSVLALYDTKLADNTGDPPGVPHETSSGEYNFMVELLTHHITWEHYTFEIFTKSNSTLSTLVFESEGSITFNATGIEDTSGFTYITIPRQMMDGVLSVLIDNAPVPFALWQNSTHNTLYFVYAHSHKNIKILATTVIPEFTAFSTVLLLLIAMLSVAVARKKQLMKKQS